MAASSPTAASMACVAGTLPPSLLAVISDPQNHVVASLISTLPTEASSDGALSRANANEAKYAVFDDAVAAHRWTVELRCCSADTASVEWRLDGAANAASSSSLQSSDVATGLYTEPPRCAAGARYIMLQNTWRQTPLAPASTPSAAPPVPPAALVEASPAVIAEPRRDAPPATTDTAHAAHREIPSESSALAKKGSSRGASPPAPPPPPVSLPDATHAPAPPQPTSERLISNLKGLSMQELANQHNALARLLVQTLAPQRMTVALVVRQVCTSSSAAAATGRPTCDVHDDAAVSPSGEPLRYTDAAVAAAVEQLTVPHARHPMLRELKSEAYLLMNIGGFVDGALRHKAVNRAYPALAHHWPASAPLLDAMERYADRDVVLETRKRHPALNDPIGGDDGGDEGGGRGGRKRRRSHSSASSGDDGEGGEGGEDGVSGRIAAAPSPTASVEQSNHTGVTPVPRAFLFTSLQECPQSLERGDLQVWRSSAEAAQVSEALQAATVLAQSSSGHSSPSGTSTAAAGLTALPIATEEDVTVLRGQYDALARAEEALERQLRDYGDTVHELRKWYRGEQCAPQFRTELAAWVHSQEAARVALVTLLERVHTVRYRLERDLSEYLHLHALRVF